MGGGPTIVMRVGGIGNPGDMLGALAQNLFNHVNPIGYSGVMTSPFCGSPTAAMPGRRLDVGLRLGL